MTRSTPRAPDKGAGRLVALVGIDGVGKSTQVRRLARALRTLGHDVTTLRQFAGSLGRTLKEQVARTKDPEIRALLFAADYYGLKPRITRELTRREYVLTDRAPWCARAYLGPRGIDEEFLSGLYRGAHVPDVTFLLDLPVEDALRRKPFDAFVPVRTRRFFESVRTEYLRLAREHDLVVVDARKSKADVTASLVATLRQR